MQPYSSYLTASEEGEFPTLYWAKNLSTNLHALLQKLCSMEILKG